jgi:hypothetical protein
MVRMRVAVLLLLAAAAAAQGIAVEPLAPDPARDAQVAKLIEDLLAIAKPYDGITLTSGGGVGFDATWSDEDTPPAFRELVRLGPAAMPALLAHLDDARETKLKFRWIDADWGDDARGSRMFLQPEIDAGGQEERVRIRRVLGAEAEKEGPIDRGLGKRIDGHTVTVGDCCFVVLGQIVNRSYEAVRYRPSLMAVVSSPTRDPRIAKVVRGRWGRGDPRQLLMESLLDDFRRTRGSRLQTGAAERLLFYSPDSSGPLVAKRISTLHWDDLGGEQWELDGLDAIDLLRRTARTGHPLARAEWLKLLDPQRRKAIQFAALDCTPQDPGEDGRERIRAILRGTMDAELMLACLLGLRGEKPEGLLPRLEANLAAAEKVDREATQQTLSALVLIDDPSSLRLFRAHMERLGDEGCETVLSTLDDNLTSGLTRSLLPLLLEVRAPVQKLPGLPEPIWMNKGETRLCDWAAHLATMMKPDLVFDRDAPVEERDKQIAAIRAALAK